MRARSSSSPPTVPLFVVYPRERKREVRRGPSAGDGAGGEGNLRRSSRIFTRAACAALGGIYVYSSRSGWCVYIYVACFKRKRCVDGSDTGEFSRGG